MLLAKFCHQEDSLIVHGASVPVRDSAFRLFTITPCPWWCHSGDKCCHCKPCFPQSETKVWLKKVLALPVVLRIECQHNFTCMRLHVRHSYIYGPSSASSPTTVLARVLAVPLMLFWISCNDDQLQSIPNDIFDLHQFRVSLHPSKPTGPCLLTEKERWRVYEKYRWEKLLDTKIANLHSSSSPDWLHKRRATRTTTQTSITIPRPSTTIIKGIFHFFFTFRLDNCWCQFSFLILWNVQIPQRAQPTTQYNKLHFLFRSLSLFIGTASMKDIFKMTFF